jgi:hypothetical protein
VCLFEKLKLYYLHSLLDANSTNVCRCPPICSTHPVYTHVHVSVTEKTNAFLRVQTRTVNLNLRREYVFIVDSFDSDSLERGVVVK